MTRQKKAFNLQPQPWSVTVGYDPTLFVETSEVVSYLGSQTRLELEMYLHNVLRVTDPVVQYEAVALSEDLGYPEVVIFIDVPTRWLQNPLLEQIVDIVSKEVFVIRRLHITQTHLPTGLRRLVQVQVVATQPGGLSINRVHNTGQLTSPT